MPSTSPASTRILASLLGASLFVTACGGAIPKSGRAGDAVPFLDVSAQAGLDFTHINGMTGERYFVEMVGSGAAMFDYDEDGDLDLYLVQGGPLPPGLDGSDAQGPPMDRLLRNDLGGDSDPEPALRFVDVTDESGLRSTGYGMGVATGDFDNDGWTDLYVTNFGPNQLWRNRGDGSFEDVTESSGAGDERWSTSAAFLDYDRDGWLDLMVVNYVEYSIEGNRPCHVPRTGELEYCGPSTYPPLPDRLLHNRGDGSFEDATLRMGLHDAFGPGLGVVTGDFDQDGWIDIYVANDGEANQLWRNRGGSGFEDIAMQSGAAMNAYGNPQASMGVVAADFDTDGDADLFMTHLTGETNTFYRNDGNGMFTDQSEGTGLGSPSLGLTGFGTAAIDYDHDGLLDLFVANGAVRVIPEQLSAGEALPMRQRNQLFHNLGEARFEELSAATAAFLAGEDVSRGLSAGDLDNDGDADLLIMNNGGKAQLLLNVLGQDRSWIGVDARLRGRPGLGSVITLVESGGARLASATVSSDGSYCSAKDPRVRFGLGSRTRGLDVRIDWPDGEVEVWPSLTLGSYHRLEQGSAP